MYLDYIYDDTATLSGCQDDQGVDLYTCDFAIIDRDHLEDGKPYVLDNWQAVFTLADQEYEIAEQKESAEHIIANLKKYIECFRLLVEKQELQEKITYSREIHAGDLASEFEYRFMAIENQLLEHDHARKTVLAALAYNEVNLGNVDEDWIVENMINDGIYLSMSHHF